MIVQTNQLGQGEVNHEESDGGDENEEEEAPIILEPRKWKGVYQNYIIKGKPLRSPPRTKRRGRKHFQKLMKCLEEKERLLIIFLGS